MGANFRLPFRSPTPRRYHEPIKCRTAWVATTAFQRFRTISSIMKLTTFLFLKVQQVTEQWCLLPRVYFDLFPLALFAHERSPATFSYAWTASLHWFQSWLDCQVLKTFQLLIMLPDPVKYNHTGSPWSITFISKPRKLLHALNILFSKTSLFLDYKAPQATVIPSHPSGNGIWVIDAGSMAAQSFMGCVIAVVQPWRAQSSVPAVCAVAPVTKTPHSHSTGMQAGRYTQAWFFFHCLNKSLKSTL